jgi:alkylhydroperoxidase/carboxymuconolactone decarboxylase family protein YurZ
MIIDTASDPDYTRAIAELIWDCTRVVLDPREGYGCRSIAQGGRLMPTERDKQAEKERVTRISGFRVGYHDFLAEVDLEALKQRNDRWEAEHRHQSRLDRKTEELIRIAAYVAMRNPPHHIQIHVHSAHKAGATPEEIYQVIDRVGGWAGGAARQNGMEAWRLVFRPDLPTIERVVELTDDSFAR